MLKAIYTYLLVVTFAFTLSPDAMAESPQPIQLEDNEIVKYLTGKYQASKHPAFSPVPKRYANRSGYYLRTEVLDAFKKMHAAAKKDGINLVIRSATRSFYHQKSIWERKWKAKSRRSLGASARARSILQYNSMPGTSRHHWGTEIDINAFKNSWFESGKGLKLFNWMNANAHKYGFQRPYTAKNQHRPNGYNEEKWHWSYTPLSIQMTRDAKLALSNQDISGFSGSNTASKLDVKRNYVLGVDKCCK